MAGKGMGLLALVPHEPDGDEPSGDGKDMGDDYSPEAKTSLAEKFFAAGEEGDFKKAGEALEKFVHLCSGD